MSKHLKISDTLNLPLELAARTQCIFAQKGAGKTYAAGVMTEEMLGAGVQCVVLDPTGVWWGLQSSADGGKSPYEIIVMGGGHADVPLEPDAGEVIADFLVETGQSVVLDVSQFESQAAQDRFALALATRLYRQKAHDKANIHIFLDEADQFCPMKPQKGQERLLHAWDLIVRLGRSRGLGLTAISQRPAVVHTNIRNNVDLLTCLRVTGPHDFKALREWTGIHATKDQAAEFLESVPSLADGEAFFWSPAWLKIFQRAKVRQKETFDSSRTPKPGERSIEPKARRAPDLTKLTEQIMATVQRAKANDPKELKAELARVKKELLAAQAAKPAATVKMETKIVEKPVIKDSLIVRLESLHEKVSKRAGETWDRLQKQINPLMDLLNEEKKQIGELLASARTVNASKTQVPTLRRAFSAEKPALPISLGINPPARRVSGQASEVLTRAQQRILDAIAWWNSIGVEAPSRAMVGFLAGIKPTGGHFSNTIGPLGTNGYIFYVGDGIKLDATGAELAAVPEVATDLAGYHAMIRKLLKGGATQRIFDVIVGYGTGGSSIEQIGQDAGIDPSGGHFSNSIGPLGTLGVIERRAGHVQPTALLFPEGLS